MPIDPWFAAGCPALINQPVLEAVEAITLLYRTHKTGGRLARLIDEAHCEDGLAAKCIDEALANGDAVERACAEAIVNLTEQERWTAVLLRQDLVHATGDKMLELIAGDDDALEEYLAYRDEVNRGSTDTPVAPPPTPPDTPA